MFTLLRDDRLSRAINSFKAKEQRVTRWLDGCALQNEPLHELFIDEPIAGMSSHACYGIDFDCHFVSLHNGFAIDIQINECHVQYYNI